MIMVWQKKFPPFKIKNWFLAIFVILAKSQKWPKIYFFSFEKWNFFLAHLNHLGRLNFFVFYTFWFDKKNGQNWKKPLSCTAHFFSFSQKCQKYQFPSKNIFLWVISDRKGLLYFWRIPIFELARAILLWRVWYQPFRLKFRVPYPPQQNGSSGFRYMCLSKVYKTFSDRNYS